VKISKIEKNSKSQDMKIYTATKFSIVIVPPSFSEKTKESKLLVRSFRHIYKVAGLGIATGLSAIISLTQLENKVPSSMISSRIASPELSSKTSESIGMDESAESIAAAPMVAESESRMQLESVESQDYVQENLDVVETVIDSDVSNLGTELFIPFVILTAILGGITIYYLIKYLKN
ncbi:MAG: ArsR family transcriptional regulator, partial [Nitrosopumilus sp.]|nr:ArsR family transcriptional regulator [Nitrosopumilus sp.]